MCLTLRIESCKMIFETANLPYEGGTFALTSKPSVTTSYFHRQSSAKECSSCRRRDSRLPVISSSLAELCKRRRLNVTGNKGKESICSSGTRARTGAVLRGVFEHGSQPRLRNSAGAFGKDEAGNGCEAVGRSGHSFQSAYGKRAVDAQSNPERNNRVDQSSCAGVGRKFSQRINNFNFTRQAFCRDLRLCGKPVLIQGEICQFN